jgi:hypothetical protein
VQVLTSDEWSNISNGIADENVIVPNSTTQVWGSIEPYTQTNATLCKWDNNKCKTDISWLISAQGMRKSSFQDNMVNYILRYHLMGACYKSQVVRICTSFISKYLTDTTRCCAPVGCSLLIACHLLKHWLLPHAAFG